MVTLSPAAYGSILLIESIALSAWFLAAPPEPDEGRLLFLGWAGLASMLVMLVYSIARRSQTLRRRYPLRRWLHFHIFCGFQGALLAAFHCGPMLASRAGPVQWLNPGVLNALAVGVVIGSGTFGRYLYTMLPRTRRGEALAAREAQEALDEETLERLPAEVLALCRSEGPEDLRATGLVGLVRADWRTRRALRDLKSIAMDDEQRALAERRVRLERRLEMLAGAQPWFELWIFVHRPMALTLYVISFVHVMLSLMFRV